MKQIETFSLNDLKDAEIAGYLQFVAETTSLLTLPNDAKRVKSFVVMVNKFVNETKPSRINSFTEARKRTDKVAKNLYSGIWYYIKGITYHPDSEMQRIAKKVFNIIQKYEINSNTCYVHRYPRLSTLISELKELSAQERSSLNIDAWIDAIEQAHDNFTTATDNAIEEKSQRQVGIIRTLRKESQTVYYNFVTYINAGVMINGEEPYTDFIDNINVLVAEYKAHLAARRTRHKNKDEENETPEYEI